MTSPFIKSEPSDYNNFDPNQYMLFNGQQSHNMSNSNGNMNINPANLTNGNSNNGYMSSSFMGNSGIADDELLDLHIDQAQPQSTFDFNSGMSNNFINPHTMSQQSPGVFSNAAENGSMASPFTNDFNNYNQFRAPGQPFGAHSMPQQQQTGFRPHMQHADRKVSDSRSPATPNTPSINHLHIDDYSHPGMQPIHRPHTSVGNGWESAGHSWDQSSPFPSPANGQPVHPQISEVLRNNNNNTHHHKVASSLPTKMEPGIVTPQDAKRKRRRESHNMVERRRRDNINERIHDLGTLVPPHRLEDEKIRKHLQTNAPLSPSIINATSMSPPNASASLLGGAASRRTGPGSITQGLPTEDKDKGPNKGDILNGSVAWTRDMMWYMHLKLRQEQEVKELVTRLGGNWPFEVTEDELRMRSEIQEVLNRHSADGYSGFNGYSRAPGSGLRVPGHTNMAGDSISDGQSSNGLSLPPISPGYQPGGSGMSSGMSHNATNQYWGSDLKEEDEYELMQ